MSVNKYKVGVLGTGTVGSVVIEMLDSHPTLELSGILNTRRGAFKNILAESDVIIELIGGIESAREYISAALSTGTHVVTANKQLIAAYGQELAELARANNAELRYEAAVVGAVPIISALQDQLSTQRVRQLVGIVNGTSNYILGEMTSQQLELPEALALAQQLGYAESDPADDLTGADAAAKLAILARLSMNVAVDINDVSYQGIEDIHADDLAYAQRFNLALKLLASAAYDGERLSLQVAPCFVSNSNPLAGIREATNCVQLQIDEIGELLFSGPGAGARPTAATVIGDVSRIIRGDKAPELESNADFKLDNDTHSSFYLHLLVRDCPGTLADIAAIFGDHRLSIASAVQWGVGTDARLIMIIHPCLHSEIAGAAKMLNQLEVVRSTPRILRLLEPV